MEPQILNNDQLVALFDQPAWVWSLDGTCLAQNNALQTVLKQGQGDSVVGLPTGPKAQAMLDAVLITPDLVVERVVRFHDEFGEPTQQLCRLRALRDGSRVVGVLGTCVPTVTRQTPDPHNFCPIKPTKGTDVSKEVLIRVADNSPAALFELRAFHNGSVFIPYSNARLAELFGVSSEAMQGRGDATFGQVHEEDQPRLLCAMEQAIQQHALIDIKYRVNHPFRGEIWHHTVCQPEPQADGTTVFYGTVHDVTEHAKVEAQALAAAKAAQKARERLDQFAEHSPASMVEMRISADKVFSFDYITDRFAKTLGLPLEKLLEDASLAFGAIHREDMPSVSEAVAKSLRDLTLLSSECRLLSPEHGEIWLYAQAAPRRQPDGSTVWYGTVTDVTDQVEARARHQQAVAEKEGALTLLNEITASVPAGLARIRCEPGGARVAEYFNAQMHELLGVTAEDVLAGWEQTHKHVHPDDVERLAGSATKVIKEIVPHSDRFRVNHPELGEIWVMTHISPKPEADGSVILYSNAFDITQQVALETEATLAHERLKRIADTVPVGLYETSQTEAGQESLYFTSAKFDQLAGLTATDPAQKHIEFLGNIHAKDRAMTQKVSQQARDKLQNLTCRFRYLPPDGHETWISATASVHLDANGRPSIVGALSDVTADVKREEELRRAHRLTERIRRENEHQALHDPLTGLPNRRYFDRQMAAWFTAGKSDEVLNDITLVRIDGDRFKYINDTFGHEAGDQVLQRIGEVMARETREQDFAARVGGDEFSILLRGPKAERTAEHLIQRIREGLCAPLSFGGIRCIIQASFGVATVDAREEGEDDLLLFADAALYRAKEQGRDRMQLFSPALRTEITDERQIASDLHRAVECQEFEPYFQPQIDTIEGKLYGVETLLRWNHPKRGVLDPGKFLHLADRLRITADIDRLTKQLTHQALRSLRYRGINVPRVSFNASAPRLRNSQIIQDVKALIDDGFNVAVELLESIMVENEGDSFRFTLDGLREIGVELEIDDFGSGRASVLGLIDASPVALKIDRRIIMMMNEEEASQNLVRAIIDIANALDISTIAEGVETETHMKILQDLGCTVMQGFYFARPLPVDELDAQIRQQSWLNADAQKLA